MRYAIAFAAAALGLAVAWTPPLAAQQAQTGAPPVPFSGKPEAGATAQSGAGQAAQGGMNSLEQSGAGSSGANMGTGMGPGTSSPMTGPGSHQSSTADRPKAE